MSMKLISPNNNNRHPAPPAPLAPLSADMLELARRSRWYDQLCENDILNALIDVMEQPYGVLHTAPAPQTPTVAAPVEREPDPDDFRMFFSSVMSGACWFNAVKPKLKCAGWTAHDTGDTPNGTCCHCGSDCLAGSDWYGPKYDRDDVTGACNQCRSFTHCMSCDRATEYVYVRYRDAVPTDRPLYDDDPLRNAAAQLVTQDGQH